MEAEPTCRIAWISKSSDGGRAVIQPTLPALAPSSSLATHRGGLSFGTVFALWPSPLLPLLYLIIHLILPSLVSEPFAHSSPFPPVHPLTPQGLPGSDSTAPPGLRSLALVPARSRTWALVEPVHALLFPTHTAKDQVKQQWQKVQD